MTYHWLIILAFILTGCGITRTTSTDGFTVHEITKETPTQDGGKIIDKTISHTGEAQSIETTEPTTVTTSAINALAPIVGSAFGAATGTPEIPWGTLVGGLATAAATGYAALKHGQNAGLKDQVEFHKADADEGWKRDKT